MARTTLPELHFPATVKTTADAYKALDALRAANPALSKIKQAFYDENRNCYGVVTALLAGDKPDPESVASAVASLLAANAARPDGPVLFARAARQTRAALFNWMVENSMQRIDTKSARAYLADKNGAPALYIGAPTVARKQSSARKKKATPA